jgi:hypothetical protein
VETLPLFSRNGEVGVPSLFSVSRGQRLRQLAYHLVKSALEFTAKSHCFGSVEYP